MGKSALRISLPLIMSGRTVTNGEPLRERPLFVYDLDLFAENLSGKSIDRDMNPVTLICFMIGPELIWNENSDMGILQGLLSATFATNAGHPRGNSLGKRQMISPEDYVEQRLTYFLNKSDKLLAVANHVLSGFPPA
jgi:hypothetical protein